MDPDLVVIHEHPEWQKPLFEALTRRGVSFEAFDLKQGAFTNAETPAARLYFNQASPSAYVRGNARAVPLALAYLRTLEYRGARVLNGADVFALELSKSAQATLLGTLGIDTPWSITFNEVEALRRYERDIRWPALLKPDQGGSGARIQVVQSLTEVEAIFKATEADMREQRLKDLLVALSVDLGYHNWKMLNVEERELLADVLDEQTTGSEVIERWWRTNH